MGADGLNLRRISSEGYCDRATWNSSSAFNEIAYVCKNGGGYDIKVYDLASGEVRQITNGEGSNESPAFAPNGRHIAFTSTRAAGRTQVFVISRDGKDVRQITRAGNNYTPDWSR
jgi:TolB protein